MIVSNKYTKIERNGMYYIIPSSAPECPHCGGAMTVRDSKRRKLILSDGVHTGDTILIDVVDGRLTALAER